MTCLETRCVLEDSPPKSLRVSLAFLMRGRPTSEPQNLHFVAQTLMSERHAGQRRSSSLALFFSDTLYALGTAACIRTLPLVPSLG